VISVKVAVGIPVDYERGFELILSDLDKHRERQQRSVVVSALSVSPKARLTYETAKDDELYQALFTIPLQELFSMGVPFITSSGNNAGGDGKRNTIDELPQVLTDDDLPIITVGGAT
jgi:hypothetical protein